MKDKKEYTLDYDHKHDELCHVIEDVEQTEEIGNGGTIEVTRKHPSFGQVRLSRCSCTPGVELFGSDLKHSSFITLTIDQADETFVLGRHWRHAKSSIIEIHLSYSQFVRLMGNMNVQEGSPCTIHYRAITTKEQAGVIKSPIQKINVKELTENEINKTTAQATGEIEEAMKELEAIIDSKKSFGKGDMRVALDALERLHRRLEGNQWGVNDAYKRQMDKLTSEAKNEADAYIHHAILELGERSLAKAIAAGDITKDQLQHALEGANVKMLPKAEEPPLAEQLVYELGKDPDTGKTVITGKLPPEEFTRMQCPSCGTISTDGEIECILCGTELEEMDEEPKACSMCGGRGHIVRHGGPSHPVPLSPETCPSCKGTGYA